jgi:hypothetical protein
MGENGLAYVREHFDRQKIAQQYIDVIENKVLANKHICAVKS